MRGRTLGNPRSTLTAPVLSPLVPARDEQIFFHGHPSWRSMVAFHLKGLFAAVLAGVAAGLVSASASGAVQSVWVIAAVFAVFVAVLGVGLIERVRVTYTITSRRLTIGRSLMPTNARFTCSLVTRPSVIALRLTRVTPRGVHV